MYLKLWPNLWNSWTWWNTWGALGSVVAVLKQGTVWATINPIPGSWAGMQLCASPTISYKNPVHHEPNCKGLVVCLAEIWKKKKWLSLIVYALQTQALYIFPVYFNMVMVLV